MHNFFYYIIFFSMIVSVYSQSVVACKIDSTLSLINENTVSESVDQLGSLDYFDNKNYAIVIDKNVLDYKIRQILNSNIPFTKTNVTYYFYDVRNQKSCAIDGNYCNSVQFKIDVSYNGYLAYKEYRYELVL